MGLNSGAAGSTLRLGETYQQLGHEVSYFSIDNLPKAFQKLPFYLRKLVFPEFLAAYLVNRRARSFDVIDASTGDAWLWAAISSTLSRMRKISPLLVTRSHGLEHIYHHQYLAEAQRAIHQPSWRYRFYRGGATAVGSSAIAQSCRSNFLCSTSMKKTIFHSTLASRRQTFIALKTVCRRSSCSAPLSLH